MNLMLNQPVPVRTSVYAEIPSGFRQPVVNDWSEANMDGASIDSHLLGLTFSADGFMYVTDPPFGRIFRVSPHRDWTLVAQYDGWPCDVRLLPACQLLVSDQRHGLLRVDTGTGEIQPHLTRCQGENFRGLTGVAVAKDGTIYFSDAGRSGIQKADGRVFRLLPNGRLDCLLDNVPGPGGLALDGEDRVLYVAARHANAVWRVVLGRASGAARVGVFCTMFGTDGPRGLSVDSAGNLLVGHGSLGCAFVYTLRGELTHVVRSSRGDVISGLALIADEPRDIYMAEALSGAILKATLPLAVNPGGDRLIR